MDRHQPVVIEFEHDHLEEIPGAIRFDDQHAWPIALGVVVADDQSVREGVLDVLAADAG